MTCWVDSNFRFLITAYVIVTIGFCFALLWTPITDLL
jgi:hypothetical protein